MNETRSHSFIPVSTSSVNGVEPGPALVDCDKQHLSNLARRLNLPIVTEDNRYGVFLWHSPLDNLPDQEYPPVLRSFKPVQTDNGIQSAALDIITRYGPYIPNTRDYYVDGKLNEIADREKGVVRFEVPDHQARGFRDTGIFVFDTERGRVVKFAVCTKGNGTCGYWKDRRRNEMIRALTEHDSEYPLNPDQFHARDRKGQQAGSKSGDDVIWVGCASNSVTKREVEGFNMYNACGIYCPVCLPVRQFKELPLATGDLIPADKFTQEFDRSTKLVYLAKAWALETRIWGNHFTHKNMTAAHILSAREDSSDGYIYEDITRELTCSASTRKQNLDAEGRLIMDILMSIDKKYWREIFGYAGNVFSKLDNPLSMINQKNVVPFFLSINMTENVAQAGANRLWGKPVAWHLENVGRLGEVSGGERIYGMAKGVPEKMEFHSLFSYMFDAYNAIAIEWASAGLEYVSFESFFQYVKTKILNTNPQHRIYCCADSDQFVSLCQSNYPDYYVSFRSEDAYPLVAVPGTTAHECQFENNHGTWKDWGVLKKNMYHFITGIKKCIQR